MHVLYFIVFTVFFIVVLDFVLSPWRGELLHGADQSVFFFFDVVVVGLQLPEKKMYLDFYGKTLSTKLYVHAKPDET